VLKVHDTAKRNKVDLLLIEAKATGISIAQEQRRLFAHEPWAIEMENPDRDKTARLTSTVGLFTDGAVFAPNTAWAQMVIDEVGAFRPGGASRDDLTDTASQALNHLRRQGLLELAEEAAMKHVRTMKYEKQRPLPYVS
jgi:predicted phage terminase large subunit-like protein